MIYFIQKGRGGSIKIGKSNDPSQRLIALQTGSEEPLRMLATIPGDEAEEKSLHLIFKPYRVSGEWFEPSHAILNYISAMSSTWKMDPVIIEHVAVGSSTIDISPGKTLSETLDNVEKQLVIRALLVSDTQIQAADALGISKSLLQYKLKKFDLPRGNDVCQCLRNRLGSQGKPFPSASRLTS